MVDNLTQSEGQVLFAANVTRGHPWHRLGKEVLTDMTMEEALILSGSNDTVKKVPLFISLSDPYHQTDPEVYEEIDTHVAIVSDKHGHISVASPRYNITQRSDILALAYEITGLDREAAHIDTIGNIGTRAEVFFAYIRVPDLVIDPQGVCDTIERGLFVGTSFDGTLPNIIGYSSIRVVCENTLHMALPGLSQTISVRHTRNSEERMKQAAVALEYVGAVEAKMTAQAEAMLQVPGGPAMDRVLDGHWPITDDMKSSVKEKRMVIRGNVRQLYRGEGNTNVDKVGANGWAVYNAVTEYLDHARDVRGKNASTTRATASVLPGPIAKMKVKTSELVLS